MNIFYLDRDPYKAARFHCDKHVVKMILETAQLLSTAHHEFGTATDTMYKPTHKNHPSAVWVRQSKKNYHWAYELFQWLSFEYSDRYKKTHKSWFKLRTELLLAPDSMPDDVFTDPPQCMPDECKMDDAVLAYRKYYKEGKSSFAQWNHSPKPYWY
jgi:hypothetical protein